VAAGLGGALVYGVVLAALRPLSPEESAWARAMLASARAAVKRAAAGRGARAAVSARSV
jgi:hypothetical protein